jgi:hypothetical protein
VYYRLGLIVYTEIYPVVLVRFPIQIIA